MNFTDLDAWLDCVAKRGLTLKRTQGFNNYECVENGVVVASWDGTASAGIAADDPLP